jgi:mannose-6-phosphate isomerase-like protein (cupin superfamily)
MIRNPSQMETEIRANMRGGSGSVTVQHLFKQGDFKAKSRLCARLSLPPGASIGMHKHDAEDEVYIVLLGEGEVDDGQTRAPVSQGDAILTGNGECHAIRNTGTTALELIAVIMSYA